MSHLRHRLACWMRVDDAGKVEKLAESKLSIVTRCGLATRDVKLLDPFFFPSKYHPSTILIRSNALVINLEPIRCILTSSSVFLLDSLDGNVLKFVAKVREDVTRDMPFEHKALEAALNTACLALTGDTDNLEEEALPLLEKLPHETDMQNLEKVRCIKGRLVTLKHRAEQICGGIKQLLDDNEDMNDLCLTAKLTMVILSNEDTKENGKLVTKMLDEVELLLEEACSEFEASLYRLMSLDEYITDTEDMIKILQESTSSRRTKVKMIIEIVALMVMCYATLTGAFGMNVPVPWADKNRAFSHILEVGALVSGLALFSVLALFRKLNLL